MGSEWNDIECELARGDRGKDAVALAPLVSHLFQKFPTLTPCLSHTSFNACAQHQFDGLEIFIFFEVLLPRPALRFKVGICCNIAPKKGMFDMSRKQSRTLLDEIQCDEVAVCDVIDMYCEKLRRIDNLIPILIRYVNVE